MITLVILLTFSNLFFVILLALFVIHYKIPQKVFEKVFNKIFDKIFDKIPASKYSKDNFYRFIEKNALQITGGGGMRLLDVGCGNNAPYYAKTNFPNIHYTGIDIGDYNQTLPNLADNYVVTTPELFHTTIENMADNFNAVISCHNLEHVNDREKTLLAMINSLKTGGYLYLAFPTEKSVNFPSRENTLNYFDDPTHTGFPPDFKKTILFLKNNGMKIVFSSKSYKPLLRFLKGFLQESKSRKMKVKIDGTWEYYGFEAVIWARKG